MRKRSPTSSPEAGAAAPDRFARLVVLDFRGFDHPEVRFALPSRGAAAPIKKYLITQLLEHLERGPLARRMVFDGVPVALQCP